MLAISLMWKMRWERWLKCYDSFSKRNYNGLILQEYFFVNELFLYPKSNRKVSTVFLNVDYIWILNKKPQMHEHLLLPVQKDMQAMVKWTYFD